MSRSQHRYVAARPLPASDVRRLGPRRWAFRRPVGRRSTLFVVLRRLALVVIILFALAVIATALFKFWAGLQAEKRIFSSSDVSLPHRHVALVFGAGLNHRGGPSKMLYDRIATAADLYKNNKVDKLLLTGDNSAVNYNEVQVMRQTAIELGVLDDDLVLDYAGFNTWDSCFRARKVFSLTEATLVTQRFHLDRAIFTCDHLQVRPLGVIADRQSYPTAQNELREWPALAGTAFRILINDKPRFLGPKINVDYPQDK